MKNYLGVLALIWAAGISFSANALSVNHKMGKPLPEELSMTIYESDPEAEAVVLYNSRYTGFEYRANGFILSNSFKKRIKILKEDGKKFGDVEIMVYDEEDGSGRDALSGLKAITYNLENGNVVKTKLNGDLKSEQRLDQYYKLVKFSMPNVKVGSVLEIEYSIASDAISSIDPWFAQEDIPIYYTRYEVKVPDWFTFSTDLTGNQHIQYKKEEEPFTVFVQGQTLNTNSIVETYEGYNLSRLADEDFIFCSSDYCTKVHKDITNYTIPGFVYKNFNQDWEHEIGNLMASDYFGRLCKRNNPFEAEIKALTWPESFSLNEKIDSLRQMLWSRYSWDENYTLYARNTRNLNKEKLGTSATLNFALMNMLNDAGISAYPVVMNNRNTGRLPIRASRKYLKAMTLAVYNPEDSAFVYVDASSKDYPVGVIPSQFLVPKAFLLNPEAKRFYTKDLRDVCKGSVNMTLQATVASDGLLTGKAMIIHRALDAVSFRQQYKKATDEEEFLQKKAADWDVEISDYTVNNVQTTNESASESFDFQKQMDADGDRIYLNPFLGLDLESPFKAETRELPVEYSHNQILKYQINVQLPEGYVVEELPTKLNMKMPDGKFVARILFSNANNSVVANLNINRSTLMYAATEYDALREIYNMIEQTANGKIVLKKVQ